MLELFAILAAVGIFGAGLIRFPILRVITVVVAFVASAVVWWIVDREQANRALSHELIAPEEVVLDGLTVMVGSGELQRLSGAVRNVSSRYTLTELIVRVSLADCPAAGSDDDDCEIVAEGLAREHTPWRVPPGETRDLAVDFSLSELPDVGGVARWRFAVVQTRASLASRN